VVHSPLLAHLWFQRAAELGHPGAEARAAEIAATLTPEQLRQSQELSASPPPTDTRLYGIVSPGSPEPESQADAPVPAPAQADAQPAEAVAAAPDTPDPAATEPPTQEPVAVAPVPTPQTPAADASLSAAVPTTPADAIPIAEQTGDLLPGGALSPDAIREIQTLLNSLGYDSGRPDGIPGRRTVQAIQAYQAAQGLPVTGQPSLTLLARLRSQTPP
jgi:hypothetical protein